mgnify:CR=1 FL=1
MNNEKSFGDKQGLKKWLISAAGFVITSVSLMSDVKTVEFQFSNPVILSGAMENYPQAFPEGQYRVEYVTPDGSNTDQIDYSKMAMVISLEARPAKQNYLIGGLRPLLQNLADFEYSFAIDKTSEYYITAAIWVIEPKNPIELGKLKNILEEYSVMYAFNDGSGFVTLNNARMGHGVQKLVKI